MAKRSLQKKVAILNDYITKELEREMSTEIDNMEKDNITAKNEKKFIRQNYPHHSRNHYIT
jgi:hypothetical protein